VSRSTFRPFERLLSIPNDVGLLAEGYDTARKRPAGNLPQAFSQVGLINRAMNLTAKQDPAKERSRSKTVLRASFYVRTKDRSSSALSCE
jgi:hypothetical protein